jgi:hypothetical protein
VRRKDDIDDSLIGKVMVDAREATEVFFHACEQHIRTIDVEVADNFAVMLKRHRKELKAATATNDYAFKEQLATSVRILALHATKYHCRCCCASSPHMLILRAGHGNLLLLALSLLLATTRMPSHCALRHSLNLLVCCIRAVGMRVGVGRGGKDARNNL